MKFSSSLQAIDAHTAGEPTRIIVGGIPSIKGKSMPEKKAYLEEYMDYIRTAVMFEPRGHNDMFGSILTAPTDDEADFGIIFMDGGGYLNMCGHGTIGAVTAAIETGIVKKVEPITNVVLEAPAGIVRAEATVRDDRVEKVSFVNVPAFLYKSDQKVRMEGKDYTFDIAFGGSFFAIIHASQFGLEIKPENTAELTDIALKLRDKINADI